ncbi:MAG: protein phosphatase 2C domain-containing protein [Chloroflexota bacterium]
MKILSPHNYPEFRISYGTHPGMTGKNNEDFADFIVFDANYPEEEMVLYLGIVADGVGGQSAGERASRLATETIKTYFEALERINIDNILIHINKAVVQANEALIDESNSDIELSGMATTVAIVAVLEGLLFTSHVGDSRIYIKRDDTMHQLTSDHSWVQEALEAGIITFEESLYHPNRNVIRRSLGTLDTVIVDQVMMSSSGTHFWQGMPIRSGDIILLCSDGLTDMITVEDISNSINTHYNDLEVGIEEMINKANAAGGKDNITVMLIGTGIDFQHNRMMPIPPPVNPVYHLEQFSLKTEPAAIESSHNHISPNATNFVVTVNSNKKKDMPQAVAAAPGGLEVRKLTPINVTNPAQDNASHEQFQRIMIRIVFILAGIATILLGTVIFMFILGQ